MSFGTLVKRTAKKADDAIDKTAEDVGKAIEKANKLMYASERKLNLIVSFAFIGIILGITADVVSIAVGARTIGLLRNKKNFK